MSEEIVKAASKFKLRLYVFSLTDQSKSELSKRLYLNGKDFFAGVGEPNLKDEIAKLEKSIKMIKQVGSL